MLGSAKVRGECREQAPLWPLQRLGNSVAACQGWGHQLRQAALRCSLLLGPSPQPRTQPRPLPPLLPAV